ncbi:MAG: hypothetical protein ABJN35_06240 [Erythrobacter sp.]
MPESPSMLSILAAAFYCVVVAACLVAAFTTKAQRQQPWHGKVWIAIAVLFAALVASRLLNVEEILRADLRAWLRDEGMLDGRRVWQGWLIAGAIFMFAAGGLFAAYRTFGGFKGRRNIAVALAGGAAGVMISIIVMRTISLHAMDRLLYGALKLNWVGDLGSSAAILAAAAYYVWLVRQPVRTKRR